MKDEIPHPACVKAYVKIMHHRDYLKRKKYHQQAWLIRKERLKKAKEEAEGKK